MVHLTMFRICSVKWWMMNWKWHGMKQSWSDLKYHPWFYMEQLSKIMKKLSWLLGQYLNTETFWIWRKNAIWSTTTFNDCLKDFAALPERSLCSFDNISNIYICQKLVFLWDLHIKWWHACIQTIYMLHFWNYWTYCDEEYWLLGCDAI